MRLLELTQGPRVLDVGFVGNITPTGDLHQLLRSTFPDVWGIDISERVAKLRTPRTFIADAQRFALRQKFDTIIAGELIEHVANPGGFLESARDHLADGGRVVLTTPYPFGLWNTGYAWLHFPKTCWNPEHVLWLCSQTLAVLAERAGLRVVAWELLRGYSPSRVSWRSRMLMRLTSPLPLRLTATNIVAVLTPQ